MNFNDQDIIKIFVLAEPWKPPLCFPLITSPSLSFCFFHLEQPRLVLAIFCTFYKWKHQNMHSFESVFLERTIVKFVWSLSSFTEFWVGEAHPAGCMYCKVLTFVSGQYSLVRRCRLPFL